MAQDSDRLFSTDDWVEIYRTGDEWEVKLIETTLQNQQIRCRPDYDRKSRQTTIFVAPEHQVDALEFVSRIGLVITDNQTPPPRADEDDARTKATIPQELKADDNLPDAASVTLEEVTVADREGIGKIIHHVGRGYELHVGHEPYGIVEEERWEEFTDLSAQRHEFSILLKHEYPELLAWLKYEKLMAEFIRLVESTYRDVPPPRQERRRSDQSRPADQRPEANSTGAKVCQVVKLGICLSLVSLLAAVIQLPLYACVVIAVPAIGLALLGAYRISAADKGLKGTPLALIAVILAVIAMGLAWRQSRSSPAQPESRIENAESGSGR